MVGNPLTNELVVPIATRRNMQVTMNTCVCVCVCVKPTRIKVSYFKTTCINAVNNFGIIDRSTHKVKMWVCDILEQLCSIERLVFVVLHQVLCLLV
jgi:hypothetical protein